MGAWEIGSFDNDDALDWVGELCEAEDFEPLVDAFDAVLAEDCPEAPDASAGLAAAEVTATLLGRPPAELPEEVAAWVVGKPAPRASLVKRARKAVARILKDSELKDLWAESADFARWQGTVAELQGRLADPPG